MNYTKEEIISELGLQSLPADMQDKMVDTVYQTFNMRVGMALSDKLSDEQLDTFNELSQKGDDELNSWIEQNIPDYASVVANEMQSVIAEIKQTVQNMTQAQ